MSQAIIKAKKGTNLEKSDEEELLDLGTKKVSKNAYFKNASENSNSWKYKYFGNNQKNQIEFNNTLSDILAQFENGKARINNKGLMEFDEYDPRQEGKISKVTQNVINYLYSVADATEEYKPKEIERKKYKDASSVIDVINREHFGGNTPSDLKDWYALDEDSKTKKGIYGITNRAKRAGEILSEYKQQFEDEDYDYEGSQFENRDDLYKTIDDLQTRLTSGNFDLDTINDLLRLGISTKDIDRYFGTKYEEPIKIQTTGTSSSQGINGSNTSNESSAGTTNNSNNNSSVTDEQLTIAEQKRNAAVDKYLSDLFSRVYENDNTFPTYVVRQALNYKYKGNYNYNTENKFVDCNNPLSYFYRPSWALVRNFDAQHPEYDPNIGTDVVNWINYMFDPRNIDINDPNIIKQLDDNNIVADAKTGNLYIIGSSDNGKIIHYNKIANTANPVIINKLSKRVQALLKNFYRERWLQANSVDKFYKQGGVIKNQFGGEFTFSKINTKQPKQTQEQPSESTSNNNFQEKPKKQKKQSSDVKSGYSGYADTARIISTLDDVGGLIASLAPGAGNIAGAAIGAGGSIANFTADVADDGFQFRDVGRLLGNLGLDAIGLIPVVGSASKTAKVVKNVTKLAPIIMGTQAVVQSPQILSSMNKLLHGEDLTVRDWQNISQGLQFTISTAAGGASLRKLKNKNAILNTTERGHTVTDKNGNTYDIRRSEYMKGLYNPFTRKVHTTDGKEIKLPIALRNREKQLSDENTFNIYGLYDPRNNSNYRNKLFNKLQYSDKFAHVKSNESEVFENFLKTGWGNVHKPKEAFDAFTKNENLSSFAKENASRLKQLREKYGITESSDNLANFASGKGYNKSPESTTKSFAKSIRDDFYNADESTISKLYKGYKAAHNGKEPVGKDLENFVVEVFTNKKEIDKLKKLYKTIYNENIVTYDLFTNSNFEKTGKLDIDNFIRNKFKDYEVDIKKYTGKDLDDIPIEELSKYIDSKEGLNPAKYLFKLFYGRDAISNDALKDFTTNYSAYKIANSDVPKNVQAFTKFSQDFGKYSKFFPDQKPSKETLDDFVSIMNELIKKSGERSEGLMMSDVENLFNNHDKETVSAVLSAYQSANGRPKVYDFSNFFKKGGKINKYQFGGYVYPDFDLNKVLTTYRNNTSTTGDFNPSNLYSTLQNNIYDTPEPKPINLVDTFRQYHYSSPQQKQVIIPNTAGETNQREHGGFSNFMQESVKFLPSILADARRMSNIRSNKKVADIAKNGLIPAYRSSINSYKGVSGDYGLKQAYYNKAADLENLAQTPFTSDARAMADYILNANLRGSEMKLQGDLADNQRIRETTQEAINEAQRVNEYNTQVNDYNTAVGADIIGKKAQIDAQREYTDEQTNSTRLKQVEQIMRDQVIPNMKQLKLYELQREIETNPELVNLKNQMYSTENSDDLVDLQNKYTTLLYSLFGDKLKRIKYQMF